MAEAFLNHYSQGVLTAESAGLEPGTLNPQVVEVMREEGIDIAGKTTQSVFELYRRGEQYDAVITVCSPQVSERCPLFPGRVLRRNWPFADPSAATGTDEEKRAQIREIRDHIKEQVRSFLKDFRERGFKVFLDVEN